MVYYNPYYNWVVFHPLYTPKQPGALFSLLKLVSYLPILLMEEIWLTTWDVFETLVNNGDIYHINWCKDCWTINSIRQLHTHHENLILQYFSIFLKKMKVIFCPLVRTPQSVLRPRISSRSSHSSGWMMNMSPALLLFFGAKNKNLSWKLVPGSPSLVARQAHSLPRWASQIAHHPTLPKTMKETYVISKAVYCGKAVI